MRETLPRTILVLGATTLASVPALAHHQHAVGRVGTEPPAAVAGRDHEARFAVAARYLFAFFDRSLAGGDVVDGHPLGSVTVNQVTVAGELWLTHRLQVSAALPAGFVSTRRGDGASELTTGIGDARLTAGAELIPGESVFGLSIAAGIVAPTGHYARDSSLSVDDVRATGDGELVPVTYDARASLGDGSWSAFGVASGRWRVHPRVQLELGGGWLERVSDTPDDMHWGSDAWLSPAVDAAAVPGLVSVRAGGALRWHRRDRAGTFEEDDGTTGTRQVGGRKEISATLGATVRLSSALRCNVDAELPVWQRAGGMQLVETFSITSGCAIRFGSL